MDAYDYALTRLPPEAFSGVDAFWSRFADIAPRLDQQFRGASQDVDVEDLVDGALSALDETLWWEFGPNDRGGHHLALLPELNDDLRVLARAVVSRAPDLGDRTFSNGRPPSSDPSVIPQMIAGRSGAAMALEGVTLSAGDFRCINIEGTGKGRRDLLGGQAGLAFSTIMGEAVERDWIGAWYGKPRGALGRMFGRAPDTSRDPLEGLRESAEALMAAAHESCPDKRFCARPQDDGGITVAQLQPSDEREDYPGQSDRITLVSRYADCSDGILGAPVFSSRRYSRFGETFCYLKIDWTDGDAMREIEDREALVDNVHSAIQPAGFRGVVGRGIGRRYNYAELAMSDLVNGLDALAAKLRESYTTRRAWVLFHNAGLDWLHVPIWPDAPRPPMPQEH